MAMRAVAEAAASGPAMKARRGAASASKSKVAVRAARVASMRVRTVWNSLEAWSLGAACQLKSLRVKMSAMEAQGTKAILRPSKAASQAGGRMRAKVRARPRVRTSWTKAAARS